MGGLWSLLFGKKEARMLMVGLDAAGKTTILYRLRLGEVVTTIPTIGFNVESVEYKGIVFQVWDVGTGDKGRPLWRHYFEGTHGLIFVVDSNDRDRIDAARYELGWVLDSEVISHVPVLVFANKQDLPGAMSPEEVGIRMGLPERTGRVWHVQGAVAPTGDGLHEGLDWLAAHLDARPFPLPARPPAPVPAAPPPHLPASEAAAPPNE